VHKSLISLLFSNESFARKPFADKGMGHPYPWHTSLLAFMRVNHNITQHIAMLLKRTGMPHVGIAMGQLHIGHCETEAYDSLVYIIVFSMASSIESIHTWFHWRVRRRSDSESGVGWPLDDLNEQNWPVSYDRGVNVQCCHRAVIRRVTVVSCHCPEMAKCDVFIQ